MHFLYVWTRGTLLGIFLIRIWKGILCSMKVFHIIIWNILTKWILRVDHILVWLTLQIRLRLHKWLVRVSPIIKTILVCVLYIRGTLWIDTPWCFLWWDLETTDIRTMRWILRGIIKRWIGLTCVHYPLVGIRCIMLNTILKIRIYILVLKFV